MFQINVIYLHNKLHDTKIDNGIKLLCKITKNNVFCIDMYEILYINLWACSIDNTTIHLTLFLHIDNDILQLSMNVFLVLYVPFYLLRKLESFCKYFDHTFYLYFVTATCITWVGGIFVRRYDDESSNM